MNPMGQRETCKESLRWNGMVLGLLHGIHCVESHVRFLPKCREINNEKSIFGRELPSSPKAVSQGKAHCGDSDSGIRDQASFLRQLVTCLSVTNKSHTESCGFGQSVAVIARCPHWNPLSASEEGENALLSLWSLACLGSFYKH